jgi:dTDP-4-dehydrorhamnose reductase
MKKVLVVGGSGLVGRAVINEFSKNSEFQVYGTYFKNRAELNPNRSFALDIENTDNINRLLDIVKPDIIVSCLRGDFKHQLSMHIKAAEYLKKNNGRLYFFSTTNVFDNDMSRPHYENDMVNSCTEYGKYKIECEKRITEILQDNAIILRLPQVWGKDSPRLHQLYNILKNNEEVTVYPKLFCNMNTDVIIAKQLSYIIEHNLKDIFHLAAEDAINHKDFYRELIKGLGYKVKLQESYEEEGYFVLLSNRNKEFPEELRYKNESVINYLIIGGKKS